MATKCLLILVVNYLSLFHPNVFHHQNIFFIPCDSLFQSSSPILSVDTPSSTPTPDMPTSHDSSPVFNNVSSSPSPSTGNPSTANTSNISSFSSTTCVVSLDPSNLQSSPTNVPSTVLPSGCRYIPQGTSLFPL